MPGTDIQLKDLSDGARAYLVPVAPYYGGTLGLGTGIPGLRFLGVRLLVRDRGRIVLDTFLEGAAVGRETRALPQALLSQVEAQLSALQAPRAPMALPGSTRTLAFTRPLVMGVVNVTPDSFSDGGKYHDADKAIAHARALVAAGADILDIGGESTRPGATPVWEGEEAERVIPVIEALASDGVPLSVDTRHSFVMEKALAAGAHIINDVSALEYDPGSMAVVAATDAPVILMHAQGLPETMQDNPSYNHVVLDVYDYLAARVQACMDAGIARARMIVDPGIGFGKRVVQDNLALLNGLAIFHTLGCPVLLGASRKRFIGAVTGEEDAAKRMPGSVSAALRGVELGAQIVRVHDVVETAQAVRLLQALHDASIMDGCV